MVPYSKIKDAPEPWNTGKDRAVSRKMALESVVLLKNTGLLLPLDRGSIKSIAVIGPLANSVHWDWYGGTPPYAITPLQGIRNEVGPDVKVNYAADEIGDAAYDAAKSSDAAVAVVGNDPRVDRTWRTTGTAPTTTEAARFPAPWPAKAHAPFH